ncbi:MAG: hypothetical protein E6R03_18220 [Hyphomicrobiaceae bacterium]|nr:MAG: hypothetical protein E6R03_18220 [Hyphomicrobiaceae bacterium]
MANFFGMDIAKEGVARRDVDGSRSIAMPVTGLSECLILHEGCRDCTKRKLHNVALAIGVEIPLGENRYARVDGNSRATIAEVNRVQSGYFALQNLSQGYVGDGTPFNAGAAADNGSQGQAYQIVGVSNGGRRLTLRTQAAGGANPKKVIVGTSRINPEWPLPDPETGEPQRIITSQVPICLPVGAQVEFQYPSVLFNKRCPVITKVYPPASIDEEAVVDFDVEVSASCEAAMEPWDLSLPAVEGKYYCKVRFEALRPAKWLNIQAPVETQFAPHSMELNTEAAWALKDSAGNDTRVLWPDMGNGAWGIGEGFGSSPFRCFLVGVGTSVELSRAECMTRLATVDTGTGWRTTFNTVGLGIPGTYSKALVRYFAEAVEGDEFRVPFAGSCANAQVDPSGSYIHDGGRRCVRVDSSGYESFRAVCWKPGSCDGFALGDMTVGYGAEQKMRVDDFGSEAIWGGLWHRSDWILKQSIAGVFHYTIDRPSESGPSAESLIGGWADEVPGGKFERVRPFWLPNWGIVLRMTDEDGNERVRLESGAFFLKPDDFTDLGGPDNRWVAGTVPRAGCLPQLVDGWTSRTWSNGLPRSEGFEFFPYRGTGRCDVSGEYGFGAGTMAVEGTRYDVAECHVTDAVIGNEDTALTGTCRAWFGET